MLNEFSMHLAEQGDALGELLVGTAFWEGDGVQRDPAKAVYWLERYCAHSENNYEAAYILGRAYMNGDGVARNPVLAMKWLTIASNGLPEAQNLLGCLYRDAHEYDKAKTLFDAAAEKLRNRHFSVQTGGIRYCMELGVSQGAKDAAINLAEMYEQGIGVEKDVDEAAWLRNEVARANSV